jgi:hypothetical protein
MKGIAVLLVVLLTGLSLYGCGVKGTTGTTSSSSGNNGSTSNPTGGTPSGPVTAFTINLVDQAALATRMVNTGNGGTPSEARVVIRRYDNVVTHPLVCIVFSTTNFDPDGFPLCDLETAVTVTTFTQVWKDIQDVAYTGSGPIQVGIPVGTGYTIDVITGAGTVPSGPFDILSYGTNSNLTISGNGSTTIGMQKIANLLNMQVTDPAVTLGQFVVTLNNQLPFNSSYQLALNYNGITEINSGPTHTIETITTSSNITTINSLPASYSTGIAGNLHIDVSAQFTLNSAFMKTGEAPTQWKRTFPDSAYGESAFGIFTPYSTVTVGI